MWILLDTWFVGDDGLELAVGDHWDTVLEVEHCDAYQVEPTTPLRFELVGDPYSSDGPTYEIVARVCSTEDDGKYLDTGEVMLTPHLNDEFQAGTLIAFSSQLRGGWYPTYPLPSHLIFKGQIRRIFVRTWNAVPDGEPNSYKRDPHTFQIQQLERIETWAHLGEMDGPVKTLSDYVLDLV